MWQELVVGIIVACAALYVGAKYLPDAWRRAIVYRLSARGRQSAVAKRLVNWLDASASCGSGCGSCGSCATDETAEPVPPAGAGKGRVIKIHERR
jgi:hypothetical protein